MQMEQGLQPDLSPKNLQNDKNAPLHRYWRLTRRIGYGRDGACQTPSYWSTRNRSFGTRHPAFTKGSALPVLTAPALKKLPVARNRVCCQVGRLSIDRFLLLQYEGKRQMPSRECAILNATWAQAATKLFNVSHRKRTGSTLWYLRNPFLPQGDSP